MSIVVNPDDKLLHKYAKLIKFDMPGSDYVDYDVFPEQDPSKLKTSIDITYRFRASRIDTKRGTLEPEYDYIKTTTCTILRWDVTEPNIFIAYNADGKVFVANTDYTPDKILIYPESNTEFLGVECYDIYQSLTSIVIDDYGHRQALQHFAGVVRCDNNDPNYGVLLETLDSEYIRFVTAFECQSKMLNYEDHVDPESYARRSERDIAEMITSMLEGYKLYGSIS